MAKVREFICACEHSESEHTKSGVCQKCACVVFRATGVTFELEKREKRELIAEYWEIQWRDGTGQGRETVRVDVFGGKPPLWAVGEHTIREHDDAKAIFKKYKKVNKFYHLIHVKRYRITNA